MSSVARFPIVGFQLNCRSQFSKISLIKTTQRFPHTNVRSIPLGSDDITSSWSRLSLIKRQISIALSEEDYSTAARLRDELTACEDSLPAQKRILLGLLEKVQNMSCEISSRERITAAQALGDLGDAAALPCLQYQLTDDEIGDVAEASMWTIFMHPPPDPAIQKLWAEGMVAMSRGSTFPQALEIFQKIIDLAPSFSEAYNKLATVYYLMNQHKKAVEYCDLTLSMNEYHFGAASGKGMCCAALGEYELALDAFELAVMINPRLEHLNHHIAQLRALIKEQQQ